METTVTARHCAISDELRSRARMLMGRMTRYSPHALEGGVIFDDGPAGATVELKLHVRGGQWLIGTAAAPDHRTALDRAEEKLRRQLTRTTTTRRPPRSPTKNQ